MKGAITICPFCKGTDSGYFFPTEDQKGRIFELRSCSSCHAIYLFPFPETDYLLDAYNPDYYGQGEKKFSSVSEFFIDFYHRRRVKKIIQYTGTSGRILDIGCGSGRFAEFLLKAGNFEVHGIELPGKAAERAARVKGLNLKTGALATNDYPEKYFDAVTLFHVFEHLNNPSGILDVISRILKPGGIVMMAFPNIDSFQARLFKGKWLHLDPPRHLFFFKPGDFTRRMKERGFTVSEEKYMNISNGFAFQQSILNLLFIKRELLYEYLKGNRIYTQGYSGANLFLQNILFKLTFPLFFASDLIESACKKGATVLFILTKEPS
ncbi:MAG: class I SAM-dependent methyltransferase [Bacteroidetes bacterium]|nr:class I SAM-dependent methyltransferase [Bacteroidota bacterium]